MESSKCVHIFLHCVLIMAAMVVVDTSLILEYHGERRAGVLIMLAIEEFCHIIILSALALNSITPKNGKCSNATEQLGELCVDHSNKVYISLWVGAEIQSLRRGFSIIAWFIFIVIYDVKMYFVIEQLWKTCPSYPEIYNPSIAYVNSNLQNHSFKFTTFHHGLDRCKNSYLANKLLALSQTVLFPAFYLLLVGSDFIKNLSSSSTKNIKLKALWTAIDILDLIQLQNTVWEDTIKQYSYSMAVFIYFYCYMALITIPSLSLGRLRKKEKQSSLTIYILAKITFIVIGTTIIRLILLIAFQFNFVSTVFLGKNFLCLAMQVVDSCFVVRSKRSCVKRNEQDHKVKHLKTNGATGTVQENSIDTDISGLRTCRSEYVVSTNRTSRHNKEKCRCASLVPKAHTKSHSFRSCSSAKYQKSSSSSSGEFSTSIVSSLKLPFSACQTFSVLREDKSEKKVLLPDKISQRKRHKISLSNEEIQLNSVPDCKNNFVKHDLSLLCSAASSSTFSFESVTKHDNMKKSQVIITPPPEYATSSDSSTTQFPIEIYSYSDSHLPHNCEQKYLASDHKTKVFNSIPRHPFLSEPQLLPTNHYKTFSDLCSQIITNCKASCVDCPASTEK